MKKVVGIKKITNTIMEARCGLLLASSQRPKPTTLSVSASTLIVGGNYAKRNQKN